MSRSFHPAALALVIALVACTPRLGDSCGSAANCSVNGDRICDLTQPGGACITYDCQPDQCADDAVCVRFAPADPARSIVACMRRCGGDGDCRRDQGYRCVDPTTFEDGLYAETLDRRPGSFCAAVAAR